MSTQSVESQLHYAGAVNTKLIGHFDERMITAIRDSLAAHIGRVEPTDLVIDALGVDNIETAVSASLTKMFREIREQNVRYISFVSTKSAVRMLVVAAGFAARAELVLANSLDEAFESIERRVREV